MVQLPKFIGVLTVLMLGGTAWSDPFPVGLYRAGELGLLLVSTDQHRLSGKYGGGGVCPFAPDQQLLEGQFEGNVFVGTVLLCQTGAACQNRTYPFLAFFNPAKGSLVGDVKLDSACASPALVGSRLQVTVATAEDRRAAAKFATASLPPLGKKKWLSKRSLELHRQAVLSAKRLLESGDYAGAVRQWELGISHNEQNWAAYFGLGVTEFRRGNVLRAIESYERARQLAKDARQEVPDIYYNLACAHSRLGDRNAALGHLRHAVKLGFSLPEAMTNDADLNRLFHDDPEFQKLVSQAWTLKEKGGRKSEGKF